MAAGTGLGEGELRPCPAESRCARHGAALAARCVAGALAWDNHRWHQVVMAQEIIELGEAQRAAAVATLAAAFADDPALTWIIPDRSARMRRLPLMFDWLFDDHLARGLILGTADCAVVTMWRPPGQVHYRSPLYPRHLLHLAQIFGTNLLRAAKVGDAIDAHVPPGERLLYLRYAGVRPQMQGKGLGGMAIRAGLARAAELGVPSCLETATPDNVGLYQRLGYGIVREWDVAGRDGPHFWTMATAA